MKNAIFGAMLALSASSTSLALAEETVAPVTPAPAASGTPLQVRAQKPLALAPKEEGTPIFYKLLAGGVVVVAAGLWLKKKQGISLGSLTKATPNKASKPDVLGRTSVGVRNELLVVEVEGTRLLIGMTPSSMQTLAVLQTPEGVVGEESPELPGEAKYAEPAPAPRVKTLREQLDADEDEELAGPEVEVEQLSDRVRSLLDARKKKAADVAPPPRRTAAAPAPKARVPGQAKGLLLSMTEDVQDQRFTKTGDR